MIWVGDVIKGTPSFLFENHDEALYLWREAGVHAATLVHLDAHPDLWPSQDGSITVGNFLSFALREGMLKEIFWVVPTEAFASGKRRDGLLQQIKTLVQSYGRPFSGISVEADRIRTSLMGRGLTICTIENCPIIEEPVLLDIDVDFMVLPAVSFSDEVEVPPETPWMWPRELAGKIPEFTNIIITTIAISVEGGTTPLKWKHLGEELLFVLKKEPHPEQSCFDLLRCAATLEERGDIAQAEQFIERAVHPISHAAGPWHWAKYCLKTNREEEARQSFRHAVALDPTYNTAFNNQGIILESAGRFDEAELQYRDILRMNPEDENSRIGLASVYCHRKEWARALDQLRQGLATNPQSVDGYRLLGMSLSGTGDFRGAVNAYERYLELLTSGKSSLYGTVSTHDRLVDAEEIKVRNTLAHFYMDRGEYRKSLEFFHSLDTRSVPRTMRFSVRAHVAFLLFQCREFSRAIGAVLHALEALPSDVLRIARRIGRFFRPVKRVVL